MKSSNAFSAACVLLFVAAQGACGQLADNPAKPARSTHAGVSGEQAVTAYITGYSSESNDPPNSTTIWLDGRGGNAGGTGTYADPITVAVADGQYKYGTLFYLPHVKRYAKASDSCPPCKAGRKGLPHLDLYVGDAGGPEVRKCKAKITGIREIVLRPKSTYAVQRGPIFDGRCTV